VLERSYTSTVQEHGDEDTDEEVGCRSALAAAKPPSEPPITAARGRLVLLRVATEDTEVSRVVVLRDDAIVQK